MVHIPRVCKMTLKYVGIEEVLEEVIQKYPVFKEDVNRWSRNVLTCLKEMIGRDGDIH